MRWVCNLRMKSSSEKRHLVCITPSCVSAKFVRAISELKGKKLFVGFNHKQNVQNNTCIILIIIYIWKWIQHSKEKFKCLHFIVIQLFHKLHVRQLCKNPLGHCKSLGRNTVVKWKEANKKKLVLVWAWCTCQSTMPRKIKNMQLHLWWASQHCCAQA